MTERIEILDRWPLATEQIELYTACFLSFRLARVGIVSAARWQLGSFALILLIMLGFPEGAILLTWQREGFFLLLGSPFLK